MPLFEFEEPDLSTPSLDVDMFQKKSIFTIDKAFDFDETGDSSAGIRTPSETTAEPDDEPDETEQDDEEEETKPEEMKQKGTKSMPKGSWWKGTDPALALFTPIPPPDAKFKPLPLASLPNSYHPNVITAAKERPVSFDVLVHAAYRVSEATIHAVDAAESVAVWAKTREPPYTTIPELTVQELLKDIPAAASTVHIARRALLYAVKPVANLGPLWNPQVLPTAPEEMANTPVSKEELADAWWNVSDETQHMHDAAAASVRTLHKITNTGRTGWRKETQKIVESLDIVRGHAVVLKQAWSDFLSGDQDPDFEGASMRAKKAVQRSAEAVQQLVFLANAVSSKVSRHRFWQWSTWAKNKDKISPTDAATYLLAKMEAKEALDKANDAVAQAVAAAEAVDDYK